MSNERLSIVVPVFNEQESLPECHQRLSMVLATIGMEYEVVYVNDGSVDQSWSILQQLRQADNRVALLDLSRNFGKEIALSAGLDVAEGDAVVVMDADLQDPPELIPKLVEQWRAGFDVVYAKRTARQNESWMKKTTAAMFYRVLGGVSRVHIPADTGDFRILSHRAVLALRSIVATPS